MYDIIDLVKLRSRRVGVNLLFTYGAAMAFGDCPDAGALPPSVQAERRFDNGRDGRAMSRTSGSSRGSRTITTERFGDWEVAWAREAPNRSCELALWSGAGSGIRTSGSAA